MLIARVTGTLWATKKHPCYEGQKLLLVQPLDLDGNPLGNEELAIDAVQAGVGDLVLLVIEGGSANIAMKTKNAPVSAAIIGVIDHYDLLNSKT